MAIRLSGLHTLVATDTSVNSCRMHLFVSAGNLVWCGLWACSELMFYLMKPSWRSGTACDSKHDSREFDFRSGERIIFNSLFK